MDRDLAPDVIRRNRLRLAAMVALPLVAVVAAAAWLPGWVRPSVTLARVRTATVVAGPIDASITASGLVTPALVRVVSSPLDARVLRVLKRPGAVLRPGDAVVELDVSESVVALARSETDRTVKDNQHQQVRLGYEKSLADLDDRVKVKRLELETRQVTLDGHRALLKGGLISTEDLRRTELALRQAEIELAQLERERRTAADTTTLQLAGLSLDRASLDREVSEKRRLLDLATTKSDRDGVLTWVISEEGALIRRGDVLARIADLSSFRIDATASAVHSGRLRAGLPAVVRFDDVSLEGQVIEVYPTVENGALRFTVALTENAHSRLRPSLRTDVDVVTDRKARTLKLKRGPFADGSGAHQVFVVRGSRAIRTAVNLGVASFDEIEVLSGLAEGDVVIISDMRQYLHLSEVKVK